MDIAMGNSYHYFEVNCEGKIIYELTFTWTDVNRNGFCDDEDEFQFEGIDCTKDE